MNKIEQKLMKHFGPTRVLCFCYPFAVSVVHDVLLILDVELRTGRLARSDVRLRMLALSREQELVLVGKLPDAFQTGTAVLQRRVLGWKDKDIFIIIFKKRFICCISLVFVLFYSFWCCL